MKILIVNAGSSSFKYQVIDMQTKTPLCQGLVECIGADLGKLTHTIHPTTEKKEKLVFEDRYATHLDGFEKVIELLSDSSIGVISSVEEIAAVGHRVVQGGEQLQQACIVTPHVLEILKENAKLAPLHNPPQILVIEVAQKLFPHAPSVAVFDTAFHATMPQHAYLYPIPYELYTQYKIRKYGFHGTSHLFVTKAVAHYLGKKQDEVNLITCHLGNGASATAVQRGKSIDTTMGFTPLEGLMMGTRSGSIDPAIPSFLENEQSLTPNQVLDILNKKSGFMGIAGMTDLRDIHKAVEEGNDKAKLALDMFTYRVKLAIGAYIAVVGSIDAVVFTAGIGENDDITRALICANMEHLGITIDAEKNAIRSGEIREINLPNAPVKVLVAPTNEELEIAEQTLCCIKK